MSLLIPITPKISVFSHVFLSLSRISFKKKSCKLNHILEESISKFRHFLLKSLYLRILVFFSWSYHSFSNFLGLTWLLRRQWQQRALFGCVSEVTSTGQCKQGIAWPRAHNLWDEYGRRLTSDETPLMMFFIGICNFGCCSYINS